MDVFVMRFITYFEQDINQQKDFLNPFQRSVAFHIETSHLIWNANQITGFFKKYHTGLKSIT